MFMLEVASKAISDIPRDIMLITKMGCSLRPSSREGKAALTVAANQKALCVVRVKLETRYIELKNRVHRKKGQMWVLVSLQVSDVENI